MSVNKRARYTFRFDRRHVTGNTLAPRAASLMMRMFLQPGRARTVRPRRSMTIQTDLVRWLSQLSVILCAMHIVA